MHFNRLMNRCRCLALTVLLLARCLAAPCGLFAAEGDAPPPSEYQVKAAFMYNFIKFVTWPSGEDSRNGQVRLCVLGDAPDMAAFSALEGQEIMGKRMNVVTLADDSDVRACQVLFLSSLLPGRLEGTLDSVRSSPILTVGDTDGYGRRGVMINMYIDRKRVRFEINADAAEAAGLRISAKLLSLAGKVHGGARTGK